MKLPNAKKAVVKRAKIIDYLLDSKHPDNGGKAEFFEGSVSATLNGRFWLTPF